MSARQIIPDFIKGCCVVLMVYGHIEHTGRGAPIQKICVNWIYTFHMPLFLMISGFFCKFPLDGFVGLQKIVNRLLRPYVIFVSLYLLSLWAVNLIGVRTSNKPPESLLDFLRIVFLNPRGGYWFLHALLLLNSAFYLPGLFLQKFRSDTISIFGFGLLIIICFIGLGLLAIKTAVFFLLGFLLGRLSPMLNVSFLLGLCASISILLVVDSATLTNSAMISGAGLAWCVSLLFVFAGFARVQTKSRPVQLCAWLGRNSLAVLVFHAFFVVGLKSLAGKLNQLDPSGILNSLSVLLGSIAGCILLSMLVDKIGGSRFFFGVPRFYSPLAGTPCHLPDPVPIPNCSKGVSSDG